MLVTAASIGLMKRSWQASGSPFSLNRRYTEENMTT